MFASKYFNPRFWASKYWTKIGGEIVKPFGYFELESNTYPTLNLTENTGAALTLSPNTYPSLTVNSNVKN